MLTDKEAEEIRRGLAAGMRGPVLLKWCEKLLADRDERVARERVRAAPVAWPARRPEDLSGVLGRGWLASELVQLGATLAPLLRFEAGDELERLRWRRVVAAQAAGVDAPAIRQVTDCRSGLNLSQEVHRRQAP